jgi:hypothetical protein
VPVRMPIQIQRNPSRCDGLEPACVRPSDETEADATAGTPPPRARVRGGSLAGVVGLLAWAAAGGGSKRKGDSLLARSPRSRRPRRAPTPLMTACAGHAPSRHQKQPPHPARGGGAPGVRSLAPLPLHSSPLTAPHTASPAPRVIVTDQ